MLPDRPILYIAQVNGTNALVVSFTYTAYATSNVWSEARHYLSSAVSTAGARSVAPGSHSFTGTGSYQASGLKIAP